MVIKIISSGQTGVDRAALDAALENDIACGGWCPKGRLAEDGPIAAKYPLVETETLSHAKSSELNVVDSDGTLLLNWGSLGGGSIKKAALVTRLKKPLRVLNLNENPKMDDVEAWAIRFKIRVLNVSGPKASEVANAYVDAKAFITQLLIGDGTEADRELTD